ncbi:SWIM zinc finger family protein [Actinacidiphila yeochonensis]|uniref:SWIM zinc finger family protein n=1 Tax=Actinacidiphila yeochonensis TaxID=89050 RepID=UPI0005671BF4|nr:SWIM zinc finger family protein [Actinacidiphila yeochonensis]
METETRWTADQVLGLAPDAASQKAGGKLATPAPWSGTGAAGTAVWGLCKGSGRTPYQTVVDTRGPAYRCTCPSRKFPCKHALALLLLWAEGAKGPIPAAGPAGGEPEWVAEWVAARRQKDERARQAEPGGESSRRSGPADTEAARRRAEQRAVRVEGGASELEQRLVDLLRGGLAGADRDGMRPFDETAARMVDAQAPGLAARVRELGSTAASGGDWPARMLEEAALLHLLAKGFLGREALPEPLVDTVRTRVGFTVDAAEVLAGPRVRGRWLVAARYDTADDRLTTRRVWLREEGSGQCALVLSFGAAGRAPELALPVGVVLDGEVAFHRAAVPLRVELGPHRVEAAVSDVPVGTGVGAALDAYGDALAHDPWLDAWPVLLSGVVPVPGRERWQLADAESPDAVPVVGPAPWRLAALSGGGPLTVFAELTPVGARPLTAWASPIPTPLAA